MTTMVPDSPNSLDAAVYRAEVDQVTIEEWSKAVQQFEDANLYQSSAYGSVRWGERNLSRLVLKRDDQIVSLAQLRIVRPLPCNLGIAYLRWGPLFHRKRSELDLAAAVQMAAALRREYASRRKLFLRILPNAVQDTTRAAAFGSAFSDYQTENFRPGDSYRTIMLDLSPTLEILRKNLDQKWRNQLNRAERDGLLVEEGQSDHDFQTFAGIYEEMRVRKQLAGMSDVEEFRRMQELLTSTQKMRVFLAKQDGVVIAGAIATGMGDTGIYLFGATSDNGMKAKGAYLLQWRIIQWLKESGMRQYNLGGINPETNPGVYHFKAGLSGDDVRYLCPIAVCDTARSRAVAWLAEAASDGARRALRRVFRRRQVGRTAPGAS